MLLAHGDERRLLLGAHDDLRSLADLNGSPEALGLRLALIVPRDQLAQLIRRHERVLAALVLANMAALGDMTVLVGTTSLTLVHKRLALVSRLGFPLLDGTSGGGHISIITQNKWYMYVWINSKNKK